MVEKLDEWFGEDTDLFEWNNENVGVDVKQYI